MRFFPFFWVGFEQTCQETSGGYLLRSVFKRFNNFFFFAHTAFGALAVRLGCHFFVVPQRNGERKGTRASPLDPARRSRATVRAFGGNLRFPRRRSKALYSQDSSILRSPTSRWVGSSVSFCSAGERDVGPANCGSYCSDRGTGASPLAFNFIWGKFLRGCGGTFFKKFPRVSFQKPKGKTLRFSLLFVMQFANY